LDFCDNTKSAKFPLNDSHGVSKDRTTRISRRKFVVVGGVAIGVVVGGALYYLSPALRSLADSLFKLGQKETATTTVTQPLTIQDLQWTPVRIVNSKVYDGRVSFTVENLDPSADQITLDFDSYYPPEIPQTAFTSEADRTYAFTGTSKKQAFSQDIVNLVGGRQYRALVTVKDKNGRETVNYTNTPYVREFEVAESSNVSVGAYYLPWGDLTHYLGTGDLQSSNLTPLLGWYGYETYDPFFISKHIDWSTGHKMNSWLVGWWGNDGRLNKVFSNPLASDVSIGVQYISNDLLKVVNKGGWPTINLDDPSNMSKLTADMEILARDFFSLPQYWKLNGRPIVSYYFSRYFVGNVPNVIGQLRDIGQDNGFKPFIIGDEIYWYEIPNESPDWWKAYDALSAYALHANRNAGVTKENYEARLDSLFNLWSKSGRLIPIAMPGFEHIDLQARANDPKNLDAIDRDPTKFVTRLQIARKYVDPELNTLMITSFNDWFDNSQVEPTTQEGFKYLNTVKENT